MADLPAAFNLTDAGRIARVTRLVEGFDVVRVSRHERGSTRLDDIAGGFDRGPLEVAVERDDGDDANLGTSTTPCTATYTLQDIDTGVTLKKNIAGDAATGMTPDFQRPEIGRMKPGTKGWARRKANYDLVLISVDEVPAKKKRSCA